jgi:hypothetical protein
VKVTLALLLLAATPPQVPPARGVNDSIIAKPAETATPGPARVCLLRTSIDVRRGETAYLSYLGIHSGSVRVVGKSGAYEVREGQIWAEPRVVDDVIYDDAGRKTVEVASHGSRRYLIYGRVSEWGDRDKGIVWVEGPAMRRTGRDGILDRIIIHASDPPGCRRRFVYGWEYMLDDEGKK